MRTTIDLPDPLRAKLVALAARRGEKGFSHLVAEAVARYVADIEAEGERVRDAQAAIGTLDEDEAQELEEAVRTLRAHWR